MHKTLSPLHFSHAGWRSSSFRAFTKKCQFSPLTFLSYVNLSTNSVFQSFWFLFYCQEHKSSFFCIYYIFTLKILSVITWFLNGENIRQLLLWHSLKYVCSLFCKICIITILQWKRAVCKKLQSQSNWNKSINDWTQAKAFYICKPKY